MRLFTSHWRSSVLKDVDATIIGVSRGTPRHSPGYRYRVLRELAPTKTTFALEDREAFTAAYTRQLEENGARAILDRLEAMSGGKPIALLCWEKLVDSGEWCHRRMLADFLHERTGIVVPELKAGDLPERPDSPQPRLFG